VSRPLLATLFPADVAAAETRQPGDPAQLHPEEAVHVARAIAKRAGEFAAGRLCARQALRQLGIEDFPLRMGEDRRALWPPGIVGSITHTHGFYGVVAARTVRYRGIGIDAEIIGRVGPHLWPKICTPAETAWLEALVPEVQARYSALVFSAKEAFYKCQYELTQAWVGFHDVELDFAACDPLSGRFSIRPKLALELERRLPPPWSGSCRFEPDLVLSGMHIAA
jgi:4'-phosphopantetheinyl transferase EntD